MTFKLLCTINTIVAAAFGVFFIVAPTQAIGLYGPELSAGGALTTQLVGASFIGFAIITWFARTWQDGEERQGLCLAIFVSDGIGGIVCIIAAVGGVVNALGWSSVAIYLLLSAGFGYFRFGNSAG